jgi:type III restriction enzyme
VTNFVDRVVICDAFAEPDLHYQMLTDGSSRRVVGRRPSGTILDRARSAARGVAALKAEAAQTLGFQEPLFEIEENTFINALRDELREWRDAGYPGTARVTRRLLAWWFERAEERSSSHQRLFFCQQEAVEAIIYLYEVKRRHKMPSNGLRDADADLLRYALKMATGTGKTVVMGLLIVWSTLHQAKVSGSTLTKNFLILVPNLTVRARVSGDPRGDGLEPNGTTDIYCQMDLVPPEYRSLFHPDVRVVNWQAVPLDPQRDDWLKAAGFEGRFVPYSVQKALERRSRRDPTAGIKKMLSGWSDAMIINDEAHHAWGQKRSAGDEAGWIRWNEAIHAVSDALRLPLIVDLSATPWYPSGSPQPEGTLFEWLICDFSVYDAFESGLVKVVRLPDAEGRGAQWLDLYDRVAKAKTRQEYLAGGRGALEAIYASWKEDFVEWEQQFESMREGSNPVLLVIADKAERAKWLYEELTSNMAFSLLHNDDPDDVSGCVTIQVNSKVFDAEKGNEAILREMVSTVGAKGRAGERVRCIVGVDMLSEGWDVKTVTHIVGFRRFGSPLLTEQIIGRGLRRRDYVSLYRPLAERDDDSDETVDAFGIPFVGMPVKKSRGRAGMRTPTTKPFTVRPQKNKQQYRVSVPNVTGWVPGTTRPLSEAVDVDTLPELVLDGSQIPDGVTLRSIVGDSSREVTLEEFRQGTPLGAIIFGFTAELLRELSQTQDGLEIGPTADELRELTTAYVDRRIRVVNGSDIRDVWIGHFRQRALDHLQQAVLDLGHLAVDPVPILGDPPTLDTENFGERRWIRFGADGKRSHLSRVACHTDLEARFADFLDTATDVDRYVKNEWFDFIVPYHEHGVTKRYYPDFIIRTTLDDPEWVVAETKGEIHPNTMLKRQAADQWCQTLRRAGLGAWRYLFVQQRALEEALNSGIDSLSSLCATLDAREAQRGSKQLTLTRDLFADNVIDASQRFTSHLPVYSLQAAAGYFGRGEPVEVEGWLQVDGRLRDDMFVAKVVGHSMEPRIPDGAYCVFRRIPAGSRQGKTVLVQYQGASDPETGGSYTVKVYESAKTVDEDGAIRGTVTLRPLNSDYDPIVIPADDAEEVRVVAELVEVL